MWLLHLMLFVHLLGAISMGYFLVLPFWVRHVVYQNHKEHAALIRCLNRVSQFTLIVQLATGLYVLLPVAYPTVWIVGLVVLFCGVGAGAGFTNWEMKRFYRSRNLIDRRSHAVRIQWWSYVAGVSYLIILIWMKLPDWNVRI